MKILVRKEYTKKNQYFLIVLIAGFLISGCGGRPNQISNDSFTQEQELRSLKNKVKTLEEKLNQKNLGRLDSNKQIPSGRIRSITFRIGTKDDRLRIYWSDGSKSDLPCTKEQSIWACG